MLGLVALSAAAIVALAIFKLSRNNLAHSMGYQNSYVLRGDNELAAGHRAALPIVWAGSGLAAILVFAGWAVAGPTPSSAPWLLAALTTTGLSLFLGGKRSKLR